MDVQRDNGEICFSCRGDLITVHVVQTSEGDSRVYKKHLA